MDYEKIYNRLVEKRKAQLIYEGEVHHIVPRAEGGTDDKENLVRLSYKEHVFAHQLLARIYDDLPMWFAALCMLPAKYGKNLKLAAAARRAMAQKLTGEGNPMYGHSCTEFMAESEIQRWRQNLSNCSAGKNNPMYGKDSWAKCTPEERADRIARFRKSMTGKNKGRRFSEEQRAKTRATHQTPEYREKMRRMRIEGPNNSGKKYFNDGTRNVLAFECPDGFKPGMVKSERRPHNKGKRWFNDGTRNVAAFECPDGFKPGLLNRRKDDGEKADI